MIVATSVLEQGHFLEFPEAVREHLNIACGDRLYATMSDKATMQLSRHRPEECGCVMAVDFNAVRGAVLPCVCLRRMGIRPGHVLELTLDDGKIVIQKSNVISFSPPIGRQEALEMKLNRELEEPTNLFSRSFLEDIHSVLTLGKWNDDAILKMVKTPNLLHGVAWALHNDDVSSDFFEQRARDLILTLLGE